MESKWRQNVADLGWSCSNWRLAARLLDPGPYYARYLVARAIGDLGVIAIQTAPEQLPNPVTPVFISGNFPGQYAGLVEPDN